MFWSILAVAQVEYIQLNLIPESSQGYLGWTAMNSEGEPEEITNVSYDILLQRLDSLPPDSIVVEDSLITEYTSNYIDLKEHSSWYIENHVYILQITVYSNSSPIFTSGPMYYGIGPNTTPGVLDCQAKCLGSGYNFNVYKKGGSINWKIVQCNDCFGYMSSAQFYLNPPFDYHYFDIYQTNTTLGTSSGKVDHTNSTITGQWVKYLIKNSYGNPYFTLPGPSPCPINTSTGIYTYNNYYGGFPYTTSKGQVINSIGCGYSPPSWTPQSTWHPDNFSVLDDLVRDALDYVDSDWTYGSPIINTGIIRSNRWGWQNPDLFDFDGSTVSVFNKEFFVEYNLEDYIDLVVLKRVDKLFGEGEISETNYIEYDPVAATHGPMQISFDLSEYEMEAGVYSLVFVPNDGESIQFLFYYNGGAEERKSNTEKDRNIVKSKNGESKLSIFPNPANDVVTISGLENGVVYTCILSELSGKTIYKTNLTSEINSLDLNSMPAGVYFINVYSDSIDVKSKLIIK